MIATACRTAAWGGGRPRAARRGAARRRSRRLDGVKEYLTGRGVWAWVIVGRSTCRSDGPFAIGSTWPVDRTRRRNLDGCRPTSRTYTDGSQSSRATLACWPRTSPGPSAKDEASGWVRSLQGLGEDMAKPYSTRYRRRVTRAKLSTDVGDAVAIAARYAGLSREEMSAWPDLPRNAHRPRSDFAPLPCSTIHAASPAGESVGPKSEPTARLSRLLGVKSSWSGLTLTGCDRHQQ
jgi:hypothetical protein